MTETFKSSNGWYTDENGELRDHSDDKMLYASDVQPAEQFFTERRDAELGRWRDTVNPEYVVYPVDDHVVVRVFNERYGVQEDFSESDWGNFIRTPYRDAAERYFQTHPIHKPLPDARGLYVNAKDAREFPHNTCVLVHDNEGWHIYGNPENGAEGAAQKWHDAGQLVRLAPVESEDN